MTTWITGLRSARTRDVRIPATATLAASRIQLTLMLAASLLTLTTTPAAAEDIARLMARAGQRGTVRVLARLDVPASPRTLAGDADPGARLTAIRTARAAMARDLGDTAWIATHEYDTIPYVALELTPEALTALTLSGAVLDIQEDRLEKVLLPESVPQIHADDAWAAGYEGTDWVVAVLDTGIDSTHPFLTGKVVDQACYSENGSCPNGQRTQTGPGSGEPCTYAASACRHGTHVAGIATGTSDEFSGVARGAGLISIQVFSRFDGPDCENDEDPCARSYTSDTIAGLERVYQLRDTYKIAAVNMSLGAGSYSSQAFCDQQDSARKAAIDNLRAVGIATVAASGNEGEPNALSAPGCISSAISVGAVSKSDSVALFSNSSSFLTLLAPGVSILSSVPPDGFGTLSGTSEAAPHVAGAFAILTEKLGRGDVDTVLGALLQTGVSIQDPRNGLLKPRISVLAALNALPAAAPASGLQITPDGARTLISKDVGTERWAITDNPDDDTVTGNVFSPSGGPPQFVYCTRTGDNGDPDPYTVEIFYSCSGANACESDICPGDSWNFIADVSLPGSFFLPPRAAAAASKAVASGDAAGVAGGSAPSGLQITPDLERTLISKDVGSERWAITRNPDGTVSGNVFSSSGGEPSFVYCSPVEPPNPDPTLVDLDCSGASRCLAAPCSPDAWSFIGRVTLPESFFQP